MNSKSAKTTADRHKKFLEFGFFAPELPPCFNSGDVAKYRNFLLKAYYLLPAKNGAPTHFSKITRPTYFNFPRFGNADRRHGIVNPVSYFALSEVLAENYVQLRKFARKSRISISPNLFDWQGRRAILRPRFELKDNFTSLVEANYEYIAHTDIAAFYHSIYTHSIPWALHGKDYAKKHKRDQSLIGNLIDLLCRNSQDGQTIGLTVGPDTSRMIAELIGTAVDIDLATDDALLVKSCKRFVDDFTIGCSSKPEADKIISSIRRVAQKFELELNSRKTTVKENVTRIENGWKDRIRAVVPRSPYAEADLNAYFFEVMAVQAMLPDVNVLKFAIKNARVAFINSPAWQTVYWFLLSSYRQNSTMVDSIVEIFIERQKSKKDLDVESLRDFLVARIPMLVEQRRDGELIWFLYLARCLKIKLPAKSLEGAFAWANGIIALQIVEAAFCKLIDGKIDFRLWDKSLSTDALDNEMWLYAYESVRLGLRPIKNNYVLQHDLFSPFFAKNISFYKPEQNIPAFKNTMDSLKRENRLSQKLAKDFLEDLQFDGEDDFDDFDAEDTY